MKVNTVEVKTYVITLNEREMKALTAAVTLANLKEVSNLLVSWGEKPNFLGVGGDDVNFLLYQMLKKCLET